MPLAELSDPCSAVPTNSKGTGGSSSSSLMSDHRDPVDDTDPVEKAPLPTDHMERTELDEPCDVVCVERPPRVCDALPLVAKVPPLDAVSPLEGGFGGLPATGAELCFDPFFLSAFASLSPLSCRPRVSFRLRLRFEGFLSMARASPCKLSELPFGLPPRPAVCHPSRFAFDFISSFGIWFFEERDC